MTADLIKFTLFGLVAIYLINCLYARKLKKVEPWPALLYVSAVALMGTFGEIFVGSLYHAVFNEPLWTYSVYPIHNGYTSYFAPFIWGSYGFYLYLTHGTLKTKKIDKDWHLAAIFGLETIFAEIIVNGAYKLIFNEYLFYYTPGDLWHLTSLRAVPFYFIAGLAIAKYIERTQNSPKFFSFINFWLVIVLVYLAG